MNQQVVQNRDYLVRRAIQGAPHELCGFIMVDGSVVEIPNSAADSINNFAMSRLHLCQRVPEPEKILAIWHSHPNGNCQPSCNDIKAVRSGYVQHNWVYLIVTPDGVFQHIMEAEDDESITIRTIAG